IRNPPLLSFCRYPPRLFSICHRVQRRQYAAVCGRHDPGRPQNRHLENIDKNDNLVQMGEYKEGKKDGIWLAYDKSGKVDMEIQFENGQANGIFKKYYSDGRRVETEGLMKDDKKSGRWRGYYENGRTKSVGVYSEGMKTGLWKEYHRNG